MVSDCNMSYDKVYNIEIIRFLNVFFNYDSYCLDKDIGWIFKKIKVIVLKMESEIIYSDLRFKIYLLVDLKEYDRVK